MSRERDATGAALAARGETPAAFGRRCIPAPPHGAQSGAWGPRADCVAPASNVPDILGRHALSAGRLAALGATLEFHHGLPAARGLLQPSCESLASLSLSSATITAAQVVGA